MAGGGGPSGSSVHSVGRTTGLSPSHTHTWTAKRVHYKMEYCFSLNNQIKVILILLFS